MVRMRDFTFDATKNIEDLDQAIKEIRDHTIAMESFQRHIQQLEEKYSQCGECPFNGMKDGVRWIANAENELESLDEFKIDTKKILEELKTQMNRWFGGLTVLIVMVQFIFKFILKS
jgi:hypothetical protein